MRAGSNRIYERKSNQQKLTGQSDWGRNRNWRGATGGKTGNGRSEDGKFKAGRKLNESKYCRWHIHRRRIHLAVRKQGDSALVGGLGGIRVQFLVQRRRGSQQIKQQDEQYGQDSE